MQPECELAPSASMLAIRDKLSDIYYGNFSVFQSLPGDTDFGTSNGQWRFNRG